MFKTLALVIGGLCTALFYFLRTGGFGVNKVTFQNTKEYTYHVWVTRTLFCDELHISITKRVTALLQDNSDFYELTPPSENVPPMKFFKPVEWEVRRYEKWEDLERKLADTYDSIQRSHRDLPEKTREMLAKDSLTRLVSEYK